LSVCHSIPTTRSALYAKHSSWETGLSSTGNRDSPHDDKTTYQDLGNDSAPFCRQFHFTLLYKVLYNMVVATVAPVSVSISRYKRWYQHFRERRDFLLPQPWHDAYFLCATERLLVARSIQQFQLGEWARGRGLVRRAHAIPFLSADPWFLPSLQLFIGEEQHHSGMLGLFLDRERVPRLSSHWVDRIFRRLRKLAGLEFTVTVLVTAEVLAVPFYQALRDATNSRLLRSICTRILSDEADHLNYQALTLGLIHSRLSNKARVIRLLCHSALFHCSALLVWQQHRLVFGAAGWDFVRFWSYAHREFALFQLRIRDEYARGSVSESLASLAPLNKAGVRS
jgi:hypothetical protein